MDRYAWHQAVDAIIRELRTLVGHGTKEHRLPHLKYIRLALGVPEDCGFTAAGRVMYLDLLKAIRSLTEGREIQGHIRSAMDIRLVLQVLLAYDKSGKPSKYRRSWVIRHLHLLSGVEHFRREYGPEREVLTILAEALADRIAFSAEDEAA